MWPYQDYPKRINRVITPGCTMAPRLHRAGVAARVHRQTPRARLGLAFNGPGARPWEEQPGSCVISGCLPGLDQEPLVVVEELGELAGCDGPRACVSLRKHRERENAPVCRMREKLRGKGQNFCIFPTERELEVLVNSS